METLNEKTEISVKSDSTGLFARVAVFALLTGIPLFMTDKYFNITLSKFLYFACLSTFGFLLCQLFKPEKSLRMKNTANRTTDICIAGFVVSGLISTVFSDYFTEALLGSAGRCMGFLYLLILAALYYMVSRYYKVREMDMIAYFAVFLIVLFIAFLQFFGVNVFYLYDNVTQKTVDNYYSMIGNINVVSSYICLCVPFIMYAFCFTTRLYKRISLFILCFIGFCFLVISNSDSGYLGIAAAFWMLGIFLTRKRKYFHKLLFLFSAFLFSTKFVYLLSKTFETKKLSSLAVLLGESDIILGLAIGILVLGVLLINIRISKKSMTFIRILFIALPVVLFAVLIGAIVYFTVFNPQAELGDLENYLRFNDRWATGRGRIWRVTMEAFADMPFIKKLIGCGPDTLVLLFEDFLPESEIISFGVVDNAHNEFMNYLVNHGIIGLVFYIGIVASALRNCYLKRENGMLYRGLFLVVFTYVCQSVVNISQPLTTPYFFLLVFISCSDYVKNDKKAVFVEAEGQKT